MRNRRIGRPFVLKTLICACLVAGVSLGVSGAFASDRHPDRLAARNDDIPTLQTKLAQCREDLAQARAAVRDAEDWLALGREKKLVILGNALVGPMIVSVSQARDWLILRFVTKQITKAELARALHILAFQAAATVRALREILGEARDERDTIGNRCAKLAEQLKQAQSGGQPSTPTGAFPGGTATKMTLTFQGSTVVTDLKTNSQTPDHQAATVHLQSGQTYGGNAELNGTLPSGWKIVVWHPVPTNILLNSPEGGGFTGVTQPKGFGASTGVGAYVCKQLPIQTGNCFAQANIDIARKP